MRNAHLAAAFASFAMYGAAHAACFGTQAMSTCTDDSGNTYNVQRYGNTTHVQGSNPYTGNTWNQTSQTYGSSTYQTGNSSNGNSWNQTIQSMPGMTTYSGTDSSGNSFYKTCTAYGCN
ncbi:hypothetical protein D3C87_1103110 [compost metagenome]